MKQRLIIFFKSPEPGRVKTRLASSIGVQKALGAYRAMLHDLFRNLGPLKTETDFYFTGEREKALNYAGGQLYPQSGDGLGARMIRAFKEVFDRGAEKVLLIGSSTPHLQEKRIRHYFYMLGDFPAVLGPTFDGGFYLIGFRKESFNETVFDNIPWGTEKVLARTRERIDALSLKCYLGPEMQDIDFYHDLAEVASLYSDQTPKLARLFKSW